MATTPILNLETITELPTVVIDGVGYALLTVDALPLSTLLRLEPLGQRFDTLANKGQERTAEEDAELDDLTDQVCRQILKAPPEVHDKLSGQQRFAVCRAFQQLPSSQDRLRSMGSRKGKKPGRRTGGTSSRGSRGSTRGRTRRRG